MAERTSRRRPIESLCDMNPAPPPQPHYDPVVRRASAGQVVRWSVGRLPPASKLELLSVFRWLPSAQWERETKLSCRPAEHSAANERNEPLVHSFIHSLIRPSVHALARPVGGAGEWTLQLPGRSHSGSCRTRLQPADCGPKRRPSSGAILALEFARRLHEGAARSGRESARRGLAARPSSRKPPIQFEASVRPAECSTRNQPSSAPD